MLYEYFNSNGDRTVYTETPECVIDDIEKGNLKSMSENGYKFKINSKTYSYKTFVKKVKEDLQKIKEKQK